MCDTIVALGNSTADGNVLFGKNSDREPNEAHEVIIIPGAKHKPGEMVKCTYIEIPQVAETYQVLLAKPFWIWGAEMGSNEFGVTIGNEAVFTRVPYGKEPGLIGMDFLRLALERAKTALDALKCITSLLETHGQSGNCGFAHKMYYHNSYLICDKQEAWVLETAGNEWAAEKVKDIRTISNAITIGSKWDLASKNLVKMAIEEGWCKGEADFSFSRCYSDPLYTTFSDAKKRQLCTTRELLTANGKVDILQMFAVLRNHDTSDDVNWSPDGGISGADVCMHAGWGPIRGSQTAGSMVSQLGSDHSTHWVTGTAAPCTSTFKPVWMDSGMPVDYPAPTGQFDPKSIYWSHEQLHRNILLDYSKRIKVLTEDRDNIEKEFVAEADSLAAASGPKRKELTVRSFAEVEKFEKVWLEKVNSIKVIRKNRFLYTLAWDKFNKEANF